MLKKYSWLITLFLIAAVFIGRYLYFLPKYNNGTPAPVFSGQLLDGQDFSLDQLKGNYVLLDFWGSWCGPCRAQNPHIKALHQKFGQAKFSDAQGFHIVNIGVEKSSKRWKAAIAQDQLNWPYHIIDETSSLSFFNGEISKLYGIAELPTSYLIDPKGSIIGVNMAVDHIDRLLTQRMSN